MMALSQETVDGLRLTGMRCASRHVHVCICIGMMCVFYIQYCHLLRLLIIF